MYNGTAGPFTVFLIDSSSVRSPRVPFNENGNCNAGTANK